nr:hypothetical protein [Tanacetum cinerariifolium]
GSSIDACTRTISSLAFTFLRYVDTRLNGEALRKCILSGPYKPTTIFVQTTKATDDSLAIPEHTTVETPTNISSENKAHFQAEKEAIHLILTGIRDDIYSTVDAFQTAQEMWEAIERLQQGESLNIQDVKTNLFWEFRKFTSHDGESMESYYTRFYKLMNEMIRNNLTVTTMQVNVQFLQQLQPEWSRFVTIVKQQHKLDEVSYHKLFDILKQYQNEVNDLRAEKLARNANPLALVATDQSSQDQYYQTSRSHRSSAPSPKPSIPSRSQTTTRNKGKEIAKPITPPSETASEEDSNPEQARRDKDMQKNWALIAKYFKKIYKPTNNNLRTSLNSKNKDVDMTPRENVGSPVVQKSGIQCFNCKEYGHFAKECRKPKMVKDSAYHKEKMLLCKEDLHRKARKVPAQASKVAGDSSSPLDVDSDPDIHDKLDPSTICKFPSANELKDATDCHWVVAHVTPPSWKQYLREISIEQLCDIHDKAYIRQAVLGNVLNGRTRELIFVLHKARVSCDTIREREIKKDKAYAELEKKCNELLQDLYKNPLVSDMRSEIDTSQSQDRANVVSRVILDATMKLIHSDERDVLVAKLIKASIIYGRCTAFEEVVNLKKPFVLEEILGYRPSSKEEYDRAGNDLADASYPFLVELATDPHAFVDLLLLNKP